MMPLAFLSGLLLIGVFLALCLLPFYLWRRRVQRRGYPGLLAYVRELPRSDDERLDAVELALKGAALCILGILFPPFIVVGLVPLYYGARKVAAWRLGLIGDDQGKPAGSVDEF
jgi:hypothetical protein